MGRIIHARERSLMNTETGYHINRGAEAINEDEFVRHVKMEVSQWLNLSPEALHEISLHDVEFNPDLRFRSASEGRSLCGRPDRGGQTACIGFWVNPGRELILYILSGTLPEAFVIPDQGWRLRQDITLH